MIREDGMVGAAWRFAVIVPSIFIVLATPALAQDKKGQVATSAAGKSGQRQTRKEIEGVVGIKPMARIDNRIANRIQSRIRNRIDRSYDPQANANSPFKVAGEQVKTPGKAGRQ